MSDIVNQAVDYEVDGRTFQGHLLYLRGASPSRGLLMAPNFFGVSDAAIAQAERCLDNTRAIFVLDPFGVDVRPQTPEEAMTAMGEIRADNDALRARLRGALAVLERHGVPVGQPVSKSMDDLDDEWFDVVITVCDAAAGEACPVWLAESAKVHWGIPDPAAAEGDDPAIEAAFEATYQRLRGRLEKLVALDLESMTPPGLTASLQKIHREAGEH